MHIERVRCLECGVTYAKPVAGSTAGRNPGCPRCGYVGWILATIPVRPAESLRSGADRLPHLNAQSR